MVCVGIRWYKGSWVVLRVVGIGRSGRNMIGVSEWPFLVGEEVGGYVLCIVGVCGVGFLIGVDVVCMVDEVDMQM